jgi:hypothetical protein
VKASAILVCPVVQLHTLPDRGARRPASLLHRARARHGPAKHDRRWRRFVRDLFNATPGEGFQLYRAESAAARSTAGTG